MASDAAKSDPFIDNNDEILLSSLRVSDNLEFSVLLNGTPLAGEPTITGTPIGPESERRATFVSLVNALDLKPAQYRHTPESTLSQPTQVTFKSLDYPNNMSASQTVNLDPLKANMASVDTPHAQEFSFELSGGLESESYDDAQADNSVVSLDPEVLASLVIQLRTNLATTTKERNQIRGERDDLIRDLAITQTRLQELEDVHEREVQTLNEMAVWRKRCEEAEEQVALLRQKVEESRRAVMTLQTQSKRLSQMSASFGSPHAQTFSGDPTSRPGYAKRMSLQVGPSSSPPVPLLPTHQILKDHHLKPAQIQTMSLLNPVGAELESLRQELVSVRVELSETKRELWEATEAKEASDACLKALKDFINENNIGTASGSPTSSSVGPDSASLRGISLPPLPTDDIPDAEDTSQTKTPVATHAQTPSMGRKGWGLGFWTSSTPATNGHTSTPADKASGNGSVSHSSSSTLLPAKTSAVSASSFSNFVSKWRRGDSISSSTETQEPAVTRLSQGSLSPDPRNSPKNINDNYTPAPVPGSLKRRPSAYGANHLDTKLGFGDSKSNTTVIFSYDRRDSEMSPAVASFGNDRTNTILTSQRQTILQINKARMSPESITSSLVNPTPSLTDAESTTKDSGSDGELDRKSSLESLTDSINKTPLEASFFPIQTTEPEELQDETNVLLLPPATQSMNRSPLSASPRARIGDVPKSPALRLAGVESRRKTRSRASSNAAFMGSGMETIVEGSNRPGNE
ncbi:5401_t:CDS:2, partial [Acaulospora colombiana]